MAPGLAHPATMVGNIHFVFGGQIGEKVFNDVGARFELSYVFPSLL